MSVTSLPLADLGAWALPPDRPDPIGLLESQERSRIPWLIPERHRRMASSAFAFFRGSPVVMAADLAAGEAIPSFSGPPCNRLRPKRSAELDPSIESRKPFFAVGVSEFAGSTLQAQKDARSRGTQ